MGETLVSLLPIIAIGLIFWLLLIRPTQRRQKAMAQVQRSLSVGDEVLTQSGLIGTVHHLEDDKVGLEVAPGVVVSVIRPAVVGLLREEPADPTEGDETTDTSAIKEL